MKKSIVDSQTNLLRHAILRKANESAQTSVRFFEEHADRLEYLAEAMAKAFKNEKRLFTLGNGGSACDAEHISVEFMHPIFEKRKSLPCVALTAQSALISAIANDIDYSAIYASQLAKMAKDGDMVLALSTSGMSANIISAMQEASRLNMVTISFTGKDGGRLAKITDWNFNVPSYSIHRIQETHVVLLHIIWDLVHLKLGEEDIV
jgi:D-sedoheptulose 7-phosphate isomerase